MTDPALEACRMAVEWWERQRPFTPENVSMARLACDGDDPEPGFIAKAREALARANPIYKQATKAVNPMHDRPA